MKKLPRARACYNTEALDQLAGTLAIKIAGSETDIYKIIETCGGDLLPYAVVVDDKTAPCLVFPDGHKTRRVWATFLTLRDAIEFRDSRNKSYSDRLESLK